MASAIRAVRRGGTVVQVGNLPGGEIPVPANAIMAKELNVRGTFRYGNEFQGAFERGCGMNFETRAIKMSEAEFDDFGKFDIVIHK